MCTIFDLVVSLLLIKRAGIQNYSASYLIKLFNFGDAQRVHCLATGVMRLEGGVSSEFRL